MDADVYREQFEKLDFGTTGFVTGQYEQCHFEGCSFAGVYLSASRFIDCTFTQCNWQGAIPGGTLLRDVVFRQCRLMGFRFDNCSDRGIAAHFEASNLAYAIFSGVKARKTRFIHCNLQEADFSAADVGGSIFDGTDLQRTIFEQTNLEQADLSQALRYTIDPQRNRISKAKFSWPEAAGLLYRYDIKFV